MQLKKNRDRSWHFPAGEKKKVRKSKVYYTRRLLHAKTGKFALSEISILFLQPWVGSSHSLFGTIHTGRTLFLSCCKKKIALIVWNIYINPWKRVINGKSTCHCICAHVKSTREMTCSDRAVWGLWSSALEFHGLLSWEVWNARQN